MITVRTKIALVITSGRSETFLRNRLDNVIWPNLRDAMIAALNADAETRHDSHTVQHTVHFYGSGGGQAEVHVRGSITVETTRTVTQIRSGFDAVLDEWKNILRDAINSDPQTTLGGVDYPQPFHLHRAATSVDEDVP